MEGGEGFHYASTLPSRPPGRLTGDRPTGPFARPEPRLSGLESGLVIASSTSDRSSTLSGVDSDHQVDGRSLSAGSFLTELHLEHAEFAAIFNSFLCILRCSVLSSHKKPLNQEERSRKHS